MTNSQKFYGKNLSQHGPISYTKGAARYFGSILTDPLKALQVVVTSAGLGALFTAFHRHQKLAALGFLLATVAYPINAVVQYFPKMQKAYQKAREGKPEEGTRQFNQALDEFVFRVFHQYTKPIMLAMMFGTVFSLPQLLKRTDTFWMQRLARGIAKTIGLKESNPVVKKLEPLTRKLNQWGESKIRDFKQNTPLRKLIEHFEDTPLSPVA